MPVEIRVVTKFKLQLQKNNPLVFLLPIIELARVPQFPPNNENIPYISRITYSVKGTPKELANDIQNAYHNLEIVTPEPLNDPKRFTQVSCPLNPTLIEPINCTLQVRVEYFDSDANGLLLSKSKYIEKECHLFSDFCLGLTGKLFALEQQILVLKPELNPSAIDFDLEARISTIENEILALKHQSTQSSVTTINLEARISALENQILTLKHQSTQKENTMNSTELKQSNSNGQQESYPGWLAIDFGTSNSTVTLFDPIEVAITELLPKEQEECLLNLLAAWLCSSAADAIPGVDSQEWKKFIDNISEILAIDPNQTA